MTRDVTSYRKPILQALGLHVVLGILALTILDLGTAVRLCAITLILFWGGVTPLIWRQRKSPTKMGVRFVRFGSLPLVVLAFFVVQIIWGTGAA